MNMGIFISNLIKLILKFKFSAIALICRQDTTSVKVYTIDIHIIGG